MKVDWKDLMQRYLPRSGLLEPGTKPDRPPIVLVVKGCVCVAFTNGYTTVRLAKRYI